MVMVPARFFQLWARALAFGGFGTFLRIWPESQLDALNYFS